ncbi:MAG: class I SAM-dependent RNA methyltransferase [Spirochaetales bacterium]|nr:class I SAM-dependent RNA methyltransferase [Spirochaetales bacterium]
MNNLVLKIEKLVSGGDGISLVDGKIHFVPQTLPGEIVEVTIKEEKKNYNICSLVKIIERSKDRINPFCKFYGYCGGCNFQFTEYDNQLLLKKEIIIDIFKRTGKLELQDFEIIPSIPDHYRNRIQIHSNNECRGFKKEQSNEIIDIDYCPILVKNLNLITSDKSIALTGKNVVFSNGDDCYIDSLNNEANVSIMGKKISFNPNGFFQSNLYILPSLINLVIKYVIGENVMDLYCGVGLFSAFLPEFVKKIVAVEIDDRVKEFYKKNVGDRNYSFYPLSLERYIKNIKTESEFINTIIVDPPRIGLSQNARDYLIKMRAERIIYVSCDPVTMARDIQDLVSNGYKLSYYTALDFYPQTFHIESFGVLDIE